MKPAGRLPALLALLALAAVLGLAACGGDDDEASTGSGDSQSTAGEDPSSGTTDGTETTSDLTDTSVKPVIERPSGAPPRRLEKEDIVKGKGKPAKRGDTVVVNYVGVSFSTGDEFDASWDSGQTFPVALGASQVIQGWEKGLVGIRKGGRRKLVVPPELAYGADGFPPAIAPNETLVFVIDALDIR